MPKKIDIEIKESVEFLNKLHSKVLGSLKKDRVKTLVYVLTNKYTYQSEISTKLGRSEKTIREWLKSYSRKGLEEFLYIKSGGNNTRKISEDVASYISEKVHSVSTTITSYVELQHLISEELNEQINYGALYSHCRNKHKTRLKVSRKSHYKKDDKAEMLFKNA